MPSGFRMQGIGKVHAVFCMVQSVDQKVQIFKSCGGQSRESAQRAAYIGWCELMDVAQNLIGFQNNRCANKAIALRIYLEGGCRS